MSINPRPQPYRLDPPADTEAGLSQIITNADEMFALLYEDVKFLDDADAVLESEIESLDARVTVLEAGSGGGGSGAVWTLIATSTPSGVGNVDFTGLSTYADIRVIIKGITKSVSNQTLVRVSTNNGSSYLAASGDYVGISGAGAETAATSFFFYTPGATAARSGELSITGFNSAAPKTARSTFFSADNIGLQMAPTLTPLNALRVLTASGTFSGGTIYLLGRV